MFDEVITVDTSIDPVIDTAIEVPLAEGETIDDPQEDIVTVPAFAALPPA